MARQAYAGVTTLVYLKPAMHTLWIKPTGAHKTKEEVTRKTKEEAARAARKTKEEAAHDAKQP